MQQSMLISFASCAWSNTNCHNASYSQNAMLCNPSRSLTQCSRFFLWFTKTTSVSMHSNLTKLPTNTSHRRRGVWPERRHMPGLLKTACSQDQQLPFRDSSGNAGKRYHAAQQLLDILQNNWHMTKHATHAERMRQSYVPLRRNPWWWLSQEIADMQRTW